MCFVSTHLKKGAASIASFVLAAQRFLGHVCHSLRTHPLYCMTWKYLRRRTLYSARHGSIYDGVQLTYKGWRSSDAALPVLPCCLMCQVLPKHTLEALLVGLCGTVIDNNDQAADGWGEGPHGGGDSSDRKSDQQREALSRCVWTDLTMPVMTAALNSKPALSDRAIAALVRGIEAAAEQPKLQVRTHACTARIRGRRTRRLA